MKTLVLAAALTSSAVLPARAQSDDGSTPLMGAVSQGTIKEVQAEIKHGANVNAANYHGETALIYAALKDRVDAAKLLLEKGAEVNAKNANGASALMIASYHGYADIAALLVEKGADIDAKDNDGETALMTAAFHGYTEVASLLVGKGADLNAKDNEGGTALITATFHGYPEIARLLIEKGADVGVVNKQGEAALAYAIRGNQTEVADLIQKVNEERAAANAPKIRAPETVAPPVAPEPASKKIPWGLIGAAATAASLALAVAYWRRSRAQRVKAHAAAKATAIARIRGLMTTSPQNAYEALQAFGKEYHGVSDFSGEELTRLYEAHDRERKAAPARPAPAAQPDRKLAEVARIRALIDSDPQKAYEGLRAFGEDHRDISAFSGEELCRLYQACARDEELLSGKVKLTDSQILGVASQLSSNGAHTAALALVCAEPWLTASHHLEDGCEEIIRIHERAGLLEDFFKKRCTRKPHEFMAAYAKAFLGLGKSRECLRIMDLIKVKERDDRAIMAAALAEEGKLDEARKSLAAVPRDDWSFEEWHAHFLISVKSGVMGEARQAYEHILFVRSLRRDPKLHYTMASACERDGQGPLAAEIFGAFIKAGVPYRDAFERARKLGA